MMVRRMEDILWSDKKTFITEKADSLQNDWQLIYLMQRNARNRKIPMQSFFERTNGLGRNCRHKETSLFFIDKNIMINAKIYQDKVLDKFVASGKQNNPNGIFQ